MHLKILPKCLPLSFKYIENNEMDWGGNLFMHAGGYYFGVYFLNGEAVGEINTKMTFSGGINSPLEQSCKWLHQGCMNFWISASRTLILPIIDFCIFLPALLKPAPSLQETLRGQVIFDCVITWLGFIGASVWMNAKIVKSAGSNNAKSILSAWKSRKIS